MNFLTASVDIKVDDSKLSSQLAKAKRAVTKTVDKIKGSFSRMATSFKAAFDKMVHYAKWALTIIATLSVKAFASFDDAMQKSIAIMSDVTDKVRGVMVSVAKSISLKSITSATNLAKSYFYLASAGLSAKQSIAALPAVEAFATAGAFDMATATDLITDAQSALGLTVKDAQQNLKNMVRISDVLIGANTLANASTQQFSEALMRAGPAMKAYGISLEEGTAVLAAYADQGKKSAEGGELFGRMLRLMIKGFTDNKAAWDKFGISIVDANDKMRPMADIVRDLTNLLDGMGVTQKAVTLEMLGFQARSQQTIMPLLGTADAIKRYNEELKNMEEITQRVKDIQLKSFAAQMKIIWNNIVSVAQAIGEHLAPDIKALGDVFRDNRDTIERWAVTFVEYVLYAKNIVWAFVKFLWSDWKSGIKTGLDISIELFKAFGDMLVLIVSNAATRAYNMFVRNLFAPIKEALLDLTTFRVSIGKKTVWEPTKGLQENIKAWAPGEVPVPEIGPALDKRLKEMGASIRDIVPSELGTAFDEASEKLKSNLEEIKKNAEETKHPIEDAFVETPQKAIEFVNDLSDTVDNLSDVTEKSDDALKQWASSAKNVWGNVKNIAVGALDGMSDALANFVVKGRADFKSLAESIIMDLTRMIIKAQMAQALGLFLPGLFGTGGAFNLAPVGTAANPMIVTTAPGLQHGGEVVKTGLAVVHEGEKFSGVNNENGQERSVNVSLTINAIDTQSGMQFLAGHKRFLANLMRSVTKENVGRRRG
jgi:TP901 family phage tail tape measure protein